MANPPDAAPFPATVSHPALGPSALEPNRLAIRWMPGATAEARESLLADAGLAATERGSDRPAIAVNRTDGLWWVENSAGEPIGGDVLARLEQSEIVEWV